jgi:electron transfer flavoprotein beta subunit
MEIFVCQKMVPNTQDTEVRIDDSKKDILKVRVTYTTNEADDYALEAALQLKEKLGGQVTVISVGDKQVDEILRMALAKGADRAIRLSDELFNKYRSDAYSVAYFIAQAIKQYKFDLILTGCIATDDGYSQVGPSIAALLNIPSAAYVTSIEVIDNKVKVSRELEGGILENKELSLPALLTIQTGINKPRYPSILGIKRATSKPLEILDAFKLGITEETFSPLTELLELFYPKAISKAQFLSGSEEEITEKLAMIIKEKVGI